MKTKPRFLKASGLLIAVAAILLLNSCRTTEGFGRDIRHLGNKIENEASRHG